MNRLTEHFDRTPLKLFGAIQDGGFGVGFLFSAAANSAGSARSLNPAHHPGLTFDQTQNVIKINFFVKI